MVHEEARRSFEQVIGRRPTVSVVGHVEWVEFLRVERVPRPGEIAHVLETWAEAAGGGADAAVQLAKLAGSSQLFTALGDDDLGHRAFEQLLRQGVRVEAAWREEAKRQASCTLGEGRGTNQMII